MLEELLTSSKYNCKHINKSTGWILQKGSIFPASQWTIGSRENHYFSKARSDVIFHFNNQRSNCPTIATKNNIHYLCFLGSNKKTTVQLTSNKTHIKKDDSDFRPTAYHPTQYQGTVATPPFP